MPPFADRDARVTASVFKHLSDPCVFTAKGGEPVDTAVIFEQETEILGDLGQVVDLRPSVALKKAVVGDVREAVVQINGRNWALDRLISDDGQIVSFSVR